jgi:hypothetical protein
MLGKMMLGKNVLGKKRCVGKRKWWEEKKEVEWEQKKRRIGQLSARIKKKIGYQQYHQIYAPTWTHQWRASVNMQAHTIGISTQF